MNPTAGDMQKQVSQFPVRHCEFRTVLQPVPLDETGLPLFRILRPLFRGRTTSAAKRPRGRVTLPPGCFVASLLAVTIPLDRRPLVGGGQRWRNKGALQAFFQASPKVACFAPSFSKEIFGGFVGFQRVTRLPNVR